MRLLTLIPLFFFLTACTFEKLPSSAYVYDDGKAEVHFCPVEQCEQLLFDFLSNSKESIHCAFYDLRLESLISLLSEKSSRLDVKIVIDADNKKYAEALSPVIDSGYALMHNKFCIVDDERVFTGSMNPTERGASMNNNNILFIESRAVSSYYEKEFDELFAQEKNSAYSMSSVLVGGSQIDVYFCPEDDCADKIIKELKRAEKTIHFMAFSFTHPGIANTLILKMDEGVEVKGVMEKTQQNDYSMFDVLSYQGADVVLDKNKYNMHHKVFIIDGKTVITGSMNPTKGGDERNDENLVIIKDKKIAEKFEEEFLRVFS